MASLLATNTTAASSADFTLTGEVSTLFLVSTTASMPSGATVTIEIKSAAGLYYPIGRLHTGEPVKVLSGPGTYRVSRPLGVDCGVDRA